MRINNNMMAMNTHRQLGISSNAGAKSMEKLSSGYRINRAGDDAAGLSISEKMRAQIRGLGMASRNAQDGISLIQTAEGALDETHAILQRMRELSVQASNDTNVDIDRESIQNEIEQLKSEIDRIGNTTEFNTQNLLKGDGSTNLDKTGIVTKGKLDGGEVIHTNAEQTLAFTSVLNTAAAGDTFKVTLNGEEITINFAAAGTDGKIAGEAYDVTGNSATINIVSTGGTALNAEAIAETINAALADIISANDKLAGNYTLDNTPAGTVKITAGGDFEGDKGLIGEATMTKAGTPTTIGGAKDSIGTTEHKSAEGAIDFSAVTDAKDLVGKGITINGQKIEFYNANDGAYKGDAIGVNISDVLLGTGAEAAELVATIVEQLGDKLDGVTLSIGSTATVPPTTVNDLVVTAKEGGVAGNDIAFSDGGVQEDFTASFQIGANEGQNMEVTIGDMRAEALGITNVNLSTREAAQTAITTVNDAISKVSTQRSELGAFQNRLEHTIKNLDTSAENLQASESRIRDIDMAKEMMEQTKQNILQQASTAMLAQANQAPQTVLQLLR